MSWRMLAHACQAGSWLPVILGAQGLWFGGWVACTKAELRLGCCVEAHSKLLRAVVPCVSAVLPIPVKRRHEHVRCGACTHAFDAMAQGKWMPHQL